MKLPALFLAVLVLMAACGPAPAPAPTIPPSPTTRPSASSAPSPSARPASCQDFSHVYRPGRLRVLAPCVTLTGIVEVIRREADGDDHVLVRLDPGQVDPRGGNYLNQSNLTRQRGDLVAEPVCEHTVTQADAVAACPAGYRPAAVPPVGAHVAVTGPWVLDQDHGWQEIHPATFEMRP